MGREVVGARKSCGILKTFRGAARLGFLRAEPALNPTGTTVPVIVWVSEDRSGDQRYEELVLTGFVDNSADLLQRRELPTLQFCR